MSAGYLRCGLKPDLKPAWALYRFCLLCKEGHRLEIPAEEKMMRSDYVILNYEGNPRVRQVKTIHDLILKDSTFSE